MCCYWSLCGGGGLCLRAAGGSHQDTLSWEHSGTFCIRKTSMYSCGIDLHVYIGQHNIYLQLGFSYQNILKVF